MNYYIGIDIGTTSVKAVAFAVNGDILGKESTGYAITHPQADYSEQNPEHILEAVVNCLGRLSESLSDGIPVLVSFSAAMHSILAVDKDGKPLTNVWIWADNRAADIAERLKRTDTGKIFYHRTGVPIHAMSPFSKLLWIKENDPRLFATAHKFIGIKEYIFYRFFGKYMADYGIASATGLLNIESLEWDNNILEFVGITSSRLSDLVQAVHKEFLQSGSDYFTDKRCKHFLRTAFIAGGSDGALANLGSQAVGENAMAVTIGTSGAVRLVSAKPATDPYARTFCYYFNNNSYLIGGASSNGGVVIQWLKDQLLQTGDSYDLLLAQAEKITPGCNGLLFIPYILGERAPVWNAYAKGVFFGLDITHNRSYLIRSAIEGIVYTVYSIGKVLMEQRNVTELYVTGGFTQNPFWVQLLCDMFNCKVLVSAATEGSATGAVMIGLDAMGIERCWQPKTTATFTPNRQLHEIYLKQFYKFERLYDLLKSEMNGQDEPVKQYAEPTALTK